MHLSSFAIRNFRRLKDVRVGLSHDTTIYVGANNSGKTSATEIFRLFLSDSARFSIHDFSADCWLASNGTEGDRPSLPVISLDLWFAVDDDNLHRVIDLLPDLDWEGTPVGIRLTYEPKDAEDLHRNYREAHEAAKRGHDGAGHGDDSGHAAMGFDLLDPDRA